MPKPGRHPVALLLWAATLLIGLAATPAAAQGLFGQPKYAAIVVDAQSGEVLYAKRADAGRFPASITKVMTLYLTFEQLAAGHLTMNDPVPFSAHAASQAPSKLGVPAGDSITVRQAIQALTVKSANDAAVALAEKISGNESKFAALMTLRAHELGMANTRYVNANGLPDARQITTARDLAILSRAVMRDYPQYYGFFNQPEVTWEGHEVVNRHGFLQKIPGVDGLKTGFTNAAGYNLAASAVREGRRLITVVLGGTSTSARDNNVGQLLDAGFEVLRERSMGRQTTIAANISEPDETGPGQGRITEQGDGSPSSLNAVLESEATGGSTYNAAAAAEAAQFDRAAPMRPRLQPVAEVCSPVSHRMKDRHGRSHMVKSASCHGAAPLVAKADCGGRNAKARRRCERSASVQVAKASPAAAPCAHARSAKARRACTRSSETEVAVESHTRTKSHHARHRGASA